MFTLKITNNALGDALNYIAYLYHQNNIDACGKMQLVKE